MSKSDSSSSLSIKNSSNPRLVDIFQAKSKMDVNLYDDEWKILPTTGKGHTLKVGWLHSSVMPEQDKEQILTVYKFYAQSRSASTASGIVINTRPVLEAGIPSLEALKARWSSLRINIKKSTNSFFHTLRKHGFSEYDQYHEFTTNHLPKEKINPFNPKKGSLTAFEFDQLSRQLNKNIKASNMDGEHDFDFFNGIGFRTAANAIAAKMCVVTTRRPKQVSFMKWSDIIPQGQSFNEQDSYEISSIYSLGAQALQVRIFKVKENNGVSMERNSPERYAFPLSEMFSLDIYKYKSLFLQGLKLLFKKNNVDIREDSGLALMDALPVFPATEFFELQFSSFGEFKSLFNLRSISFHVSENRITSLIRHELKSDRFNTFIASSNRVRHTVLTRAAQDGMSAAQLSKLTGVTEPAARHYIDMDYTSRKMIDDKYIGNTFLKTAFNTFLTELNDVGELIYNSEFDAVGGADSKATCQTCDAKMGKPIGCYGCLNFRPILEADHNKVLVDAKKKLEFNKKSLIKPLHSRSTEKLEKQIAYINMTIALCEEIKFRESAIYAK